MLQLLEALRRALAPHKKASTYWVAYSGGMDSHALLSLAAVLREQLGFSLKAIHVNDHLHPDADQWVLHCQAVCQTLDVQLAVKTIQLHLKTGDSLEAVGRKERYAALAHGLDSGDVLLTAHHQQDQIETILLQLLRGAGPKGLSGMPVCKPLGSGFQVRPFLTTARSALLQYAQAKELRWVEDTSNQDIRFARNYLRHKVLPLILQQHPGALETIGRSGAHCAASQNAIERFAGALLKGLQGSQPQTLSIAKLVQYDPAQQSLLLRTWIHERGLPLPSTKKMETLLRCVLLARPDRMPSLSWQGVEVLRYRGDLYLFPAADNKPPLPPPEAVWDIAAAPLHLPGLGRLSAALVKGRGLCRTIPQVMVRYRQGGEILRLPGRSGRRCLKHLFQEWGVPPWERDRLPLLFVGEQCIGVVGYALDADHSVTGDDFGYEPAFERA